ncbi:MAG: MFS transporter [Anaerolineae bacterium]
MIEHPSPTSTRGPFMTALAWLLQLDRPVPARSDDEIAAEVARNYPWNFTVNLLDGVFFWLGASFISSTTILPLFLSKLTTNPLPFGILATIAQAGWFLPQLFTANFMERLARKKPVVVNLGLFLERLPIWAMVLTALVAARFPLLAVILLLLSYAWHAFGAGIVAISWQDLVARCFPVDRRGRFLGLTMFLGAGAGAAGATFSAWLLERFAFPTNFQYVFLLAALGISISWIFLALTREPVQPVSAPSRGIREYLGSLPALLQRDDNFRNFLVARMALALAGMGSGFITLAAVSRWQVPDSAAGLYTLSLLAGQTVGNLAFGFLSDHLGHKVCLELGALAGAIAFALAWLAPAPAWYYAVFMLAGIGLGAVIVSGILIVMEFCEPARLPTYVGIANTAVGLISALAPLLGAMLAQLDYGWLFAASALANLAAFGAFRWTVREPRRITYQDGESAG